jgi:hypothetical protein
MSNEENARRELWRTKKLQTNAIFLNINSGFRKVLTSAHTGKTDKILSLCTDLQIYLRELSL